MGIFFVKIATYEIPNVQLFYTIKLIVLYCFSFTCPGLVGKRQHMQWLLCEEPFENDFCFPFQEHVCIVGSIRLKSSRLSFQSKCFHLFSL